LTFITFDSEAQERELLGDGDVVAVSRNSRDILAIVVWQMGMSGDRSVGKSGKLVIFDFQRKQVLWQTAGWFYDVKWVDGETLAVSDGKQITLLSDDGRTRKD